MKKEKPKPKSQAKLIEGFRNHVCVNTSQPFKQTMTIYNYDEDTVKLDKTKEKSKTFRGKVKSKV